MNVSPLSEADVATLIEAKNRLVRENNALAAFKAFVHAYLDGIQVPADPDPAHTAATGCRVSGRLEWLRARAVIPPPSPVLSDPDAQFKGTYELPPGERAAGRKEQGGRS